MTQQNFGEAGARVPVSGQECTNVQHAVNNTNGELTCQLPKGWFTHAITVFQGGSGRIGRNYSKINYRYCPSGSTMNLTDFFCTDCPPGKFTAEPATTVTDVCLPCPGGTYGVLFWAHFTETRHQTNKKLR